MKKLLLSLALVGLLIAPVRAHAILGVGDIVFDPAAWAELVKQVEDGVKMIKQLDGVLDHLKELQDYAELDHVNLAHNWNTQWWNRYKDILGTLMSSIKTYQNGGAFGQIGRIMDDNIYPGYHAEWENSPEFSDVWHNTKKQMLWTKIQMKHAAKVGAELRTQIEKAETSTNDIMGRNMTAVGQLQAIKIGTEMTMNVAKGIQLTNVHLNEFLQAYTAHALEENSAKGKMANAVDKASAGIDEVKYDHPAAPESPVRGK